MRKKINGFYGSTRDILKHLNPSDYYLWSALERVAERCPQEFLNICMYEAELTELVSKILIKRSVIGNEVLSPALKLGR